MKIIKDIIVFILQTGVIFGAVGWLWSFMYNECKWWLLFASVGLFVTQLLIDYKWKV